MREEQNVAQRIEDMIFYTESGIPYKILKLEDGEFKLFNTTVSARLTEEGETMQEYKIRRTIEQKVAKAKRAPRLLWDSSRMGTLDKVKLAKSIKKFQEKNNQ